MQPQYYGEFLKLTNENIGMRTKYSKLLGYWATELGGINEVVHIWEYGRTYIAHYLLLLDLDCSHVSR